MLEKPNVHHASNRGPLSKIGQQQRRGSRSDQEKPKRSRLITNRICKPIEKSQAYAPRVYHSQWANHVEPNTAVYQVLAYLRSRGTLGVQNFGIADNAG